MRTRERAGATEAFMHLAFLLAGAGTLLLGPILPILTQSWRLSDTQSGTLIAAQFLGAFAGANAVSANLRSTILRGAGLATAGYLSLAFELERKAGFFLGLAALFLIGFALGHLTTAVNLLSALRYAAPRRRSAALSLLNFTWSGGAVLSPLLAAWFLGHGTVRELLFGFAGGAALVGAIAVLTLSSFGVEEPESDAPKSRLAKQGLSSGTLFYFVGAFFLYGGLEATVSGWLSTYAIRYTSIGVAAAAFCTTALWTALTVGRALTALLLVRIPERTLRLAGLILAALAAVALHSAHTGFSVGAYATAIGLGLAPFFPVTFSLLVSQAPRPRQAGTAISNIGLGSAAFPFLVGWVATRADSLQTAMGMPVAIAIGLILLCSASGAASAVVSED